MEVAYHRPLSGALRVLVLAPVPLLLLLAAAAVAADAEGDPVLGAIVLGLLALLPLGFAFSSRAYLRVRDDLVTVGFAPIWRSRFRVSDVVEVTLQPIDAWESHHGWGVKGKATSPSGLLYSAGGTGAIRLSLADGRRYLVGCDLKDPAAQAVCDEVAGRVASRRGGG